MSHWSHGYNVSVGYTYGYFRELAPSWLDYALRLSGHQPPEGPALRYLELGCGQGVNLLLHAAAFPGIEFVGIDFNPVHIAHARGLALRAGLKNLRFEEADFLTLAAQWPQDWGQFDYCVLHGIYSWVNTALRGAIVQCLAQALRPGGVAYNSYNSLPGWYGSASLQHLLRRHELASGHKPQAAMDSGLALMRRLHDGGAALFKAQPQLMPRIEAAHKQDRAYLVQEYLHDAWHPLWHGQVAHELAGAKLGFVGTATLPEAYLPQLLPEALRGVIAECADPVLRQELIDAAINQHFRRDLFQRGALQARPVPHAQYWSGVRLVGMALPQDGKFTFQTSFGEVNGQGTQYAPVLQALQDGPRSLAQLQALPAFAGQALAGVIQAASFLLHGGQVALHQPAGDAKLAARVNQALAHAVAEGAPYNYLVAAHCGQALGTGPIDMLLLDALAQGTPPQPALLAAALRQRLAALGSSLQKAGQALTDEAAIAHEALHLAGQFVQVRLPEWKRLGVWA